MDILSWLDGTQFWHWWTNAAKDLHGVADRSQGVTKLMGKHCQELVFAKVGLPECREQIRILDSDGSTVGKVLRRCEMGRIENPTRFRCYESQGADRSRP